MKIQLAVDYTDLEAAERLISKTAQEADIVEIGTPTVLTGGRAFIEKIRSKYPGVTLLADAKIMDGGAAETRMLLDAGADIVTVMAITNDETIKNVVRETHERGKKCLADMMLAEDIENRTKQLDAMGVDYICAHTAFDVQQNTESPFADLERIKNSVAHAGTAIAGGINADNIGRVCAYSPDIVIAGGYVCQSSDSAAALRLLRSKITASLY